MGWVTIPDESHGRVEGREEIVGILKRDRKSTRDREAMSDTGWWEGFNKIEVRWSIVNNRPTRERGHLDICDPTPKSRRTTPNTSYNFSYFKMPSMTKLDSVPDHPVYFYP